MYASFPLNSGVLSPEKQNVHLSPLYRWLRSLDPAPRTIIAMRLVSVILASRTSFNKVPKLNLNTLHATIESLYSLIKSSFHALHRLNQREPMVAVFGSHTENHDRYGARVGDSRESDFVHHGSGTNLDALHAMIDSLENIIKSSFHALHCLNQRKHCQFECGNAVELGGLLKLMLRKLSLQLNNPPFNFMIQTSPLHGDRSEFAYTHWFIQIVPQLTGIAGFEIGTGCYINPVFPEDAAKVLREVNVPDS